jgi:hypothetical protein
MVTEQDTTVSASGSIIGRIYSPHVADGCAVYEVAKVNRTHAFLRFIPVMDEYHDISMERMSDIIKNPDNKSEFVFKVPKRFIMEYLSQKDAFRKIFGKQAQA